MNSADELFLPGEHDARLHASNGKSNYFTRIPKLGRRNFYLFAVIPADCQKLRKGEKYTDDPLILVERALCRAFIERARGTTVPRARSTWQRLHNFGIQV